MAITEGVVVAVLRRCCECDEYKTIGAFSHGPKLAEHVCGACRRRRVLGDTRGTTANARGLAITELGRADLQRWRKVAS